MPKIKQLSGKEVIKILQKFGFENYNYSQAKKEVILRCEDSQ